MAARPGNAGTAATDGAPAVAVGAPAPVAPRRPSRARPEARPEQARPDTGGSKTRGTATQVTDAPAARPVTRVRPAGAMFRRPPRAPFVLLVVGLMCGGLVTLLLLNTVLAQDSFKLSDLRSSTDQLHEQAATLENELRVWDQPGAIEEAAKPLGVVKDTAPPRFIKPDKGPDVGAAGAGTPQKEGVAR
ncbi:hypothetical protein Pth03_23240 [Planotetraspora thailandica]|uniref:Cell division protein FtsL n=2 Tax=Planotetraspora thailandica TaxID=487172 RepID=A0A8J3V0E3_9ACTN|nr:hypothetical protein Pth03_23240 [Planotetraspora thailandica]